MRRSVALFLLLLAVLSLFGCAQPADLTDTERNTIYDSKTSLVKITVKGSAIPYVMRVPGKREREDIANDFRDVLAFDPDILPDVGYEPVIVPEEEINTEARIILDPICVSFEGEAPRSMVVYNYYISEDGTDKFANSNAPRAARQRVTVSGQRTEFGLKINHNMMYEGGGTINFRGVRIICKWNDETIEYVFAYRTGVPDPFAEME